MASYREPREAAPVYRCEDHWHFMPHKYDYHPTRKPWYRRQEHFAEGKFELGAYPVYAQGHGDEKFVVGYKFESGFYHLRRRNEDSRSSTFCRGLDGGDNMKLWRIEEIESTPWGRRQAVESQVVRSQAVYDESLPSYDSPYQPPPSYGPPNRAPSQAHHSYGASDPAPYQAPPSYRAPYHAPPSNQSRSSHSPYSGRYQYENSR
ncbi:hypothetical protein BDR22DRAFT_852806 [Usnea florida]